MAKKKTEKVELNALEKIVDEHRQEPCDIEWNGMNVHIRPMLGAADAMSFIQIASDACFDKDTQEYTPEVKDFTIRANIVTFYTDVQLPPEIDKAYEVLYGTDIVHMILEHVDAEQMAVMVDAINEKVKRRANAAVEAANRQVTELYNAMSELRDGITGMFEGVNQEDIRKIVSAITDGKFDGEKLFKEYLDNSKN